MSEFNSNIGYEDIKLRFQKEEYDKSQEKLRNILTRGKKGMIDLYLISDKWLNAWKEYYNNKRNGFNPCPLNNEDIIEFDSNSQKNSTNFNYETFKIESHFHLVTKECYERFSDNGQNKHQLKFSFKYINKQIITRAKRKVILLLMHKNKFKLFILLLGDFNCEEIYNSIEKSNMEQILYLNNCFNRKEGDINIGFYTIHFINKSFEENKNSIQHSQTNSNSNGNYETKEVLNRRKNKTNFCFNNNMNINHNNMNVNNMNQNNMNLNNNMNQNNMNLNNNMNINNMNINNHINNNIMNQFNSMSNINIKNVPRTNNNFNNNDQNMTSNHSSNIGNRTVQPQMMVINNLNVIIGYNININLSNKPYNPVGLKDVGLSPFLNATLQCLSHCNELTEYLLNNYNEYSQNYYKYNTTYTYSKVLKNLFPLQNDNNYNKCYEPNDLELKKLSEKSKGSNDLYKYILEGIHNELVGVPKINNNGNHYDNSQLTIISQNFYGERKLYEFNCPACGNKILKQEFFMYISFPLEDAKKIISEGQNDNPPPNVDAYVRLLIEYKENNKYGREKIPEPFQKNENKKIKLEDCFNCYKKKYKVNVECKNCCLSNIINCCPRLLLTPNILCLVLNTSSEIKYSVEVEFPEILELNNSNIHYELIGVIACSGKNWNIGHFIAFCKSRINKKWYRFDDEKIDPCSFQDTSKFVVPYILFYHK